MPGGVLGQGDSEGLKQENFPSPGNAASSVGSKKIKQTGKKCGRSGMRAGEGTFSRGVQGSSLPEGEG